MGHMGVWYRPCTRSCPSASMSPVPLPRWEVRASLGPNRTRGRVETQDRESRRLNDPANTTTLINHPGSYDLFKTYGRY